MFGKLDGHKLDDWNEEATLKIINVHTFTLSLYASRARGAVKVANIVLSTYIIEFHKTIVHKNEAEERRLLNPPPFNIQQFHPHTDTSHHSLRLFPSSP
jgi:hypothetical protein